MKNVFIISFSPLHRDPRVKRQVKTLIGNYKITCAGYSDIDEPEVVFWPIRLSVRSNYKRLRAAFFLITRQYSKYYWQREAVDAIYKSWKSKDSPKFDLIIANDIESLMLALKISKGCPVFLDAHE